MSCDPRDFAKVGSELMKAYRDDPVLEDGHQEARLRAIVSRIYYAAFLEVRLEAESLGWTETKKPKDFKGGIHAWLIDWCFRNSSLRPVANDLASLRDDRVTADYKLHAKWLKKGMLGRLKERYDRIKSTLESL